MRPAGRPPDAGPAHQVVSYSLALTVRSDSFHELQESPGFEGVKVRSADIRALPPHYFHAAIVEPAARYSTSPSR